MLVSCFQEVAEIFRQGRLPLVDFQESYMTYIESCFTYFNIKLCHILLISHHPLTYHIRRHKKLIRSPPHDLSPSPHTQLSHIRMSEYLVFFHHPVRGWRVYQECMTVPECHRVIENAPNQETNYCIYSRMHTNVVLFPHHHKTAYDVYEYCRTVGGKKSIRNNTCTLKYCIKAFDMPYLFTEYIWQEEDCE